MSKYAFLLMLLLAACTRGEPARTDDTVRVPSALSPRAEATASSDTHPAAPDDTSPMGKVRDDARRRGIDVRAVGQEPGWLIEINHDTAVHVLADYGTIKFTTPAPAREVDASNGCTT